MTEATNAENLRQYRFYDNLDLIVEQILAFASVSNMVREVKNLSPNFKKIAWRCFRLLNIFIEIVRFILSLNAKQCHQKLYSNGLDRIDITCHFLNKPGTSYFFLVF